MELPHCRQLGAWLALAALLAAYLAPQPCRAECTITLPDATDREAAGMQDTGEPHRPG
jgi:hypothetical protein